MPLDVIYHRLKDLLDKETNLEGASSFAHLLRDVVNALGADRRYFGQRLDDIAKKVQQSRSFRSRFKRISRKQFVTVMPLLTKPACLSGDSKR